MNSYANIQTDYIYHLADLHIYKKFRLKEWKHVLDACSEKIVNGAKPNSITVIAGDIFDKSKYVDAQSLTLFSNFITSIAKKTPVFLIAGNHDVDKFNIHDDDETDLIQSLFNFTDEGKRNIWYLKHTDSYHLNNIILHVPSIYDIEHPEKDSVKIIENFVLDKNKINVLLGHFSISFFAKVDIEKDHLKRFDLCLLGDDHSQSSNWSSGGYPGSLIQLNRGESPDRGMLMWSIYPKITSEFINIINEYSHVVIKYPDLLATKTTKFVYLTILNTHNKFLADKYYTKMFNDVGVEIINCRFIKGDRDIDCPSTHNLVFENKITNRIVFEKLIIKKYGILKDFEVDFSKYNNDIICIHGKNRTGKSSLLNALMYVLYDKPKLESKSDVYLRFKTKDKTFELRRTNTVCSFKEIDSDSKVNIITKKTEYKSKVIEYFGDYKNTKMTWMAGQNDTNTFINQDSKNRLMFLKNLLDVDFSEAKNAINNDIKNKKKSQKVLELRLKDLNVVSESQTKNVIEKKIEKIKTEMGELLENNYKNVENASTFKERYFTIIHGEQPSKPNTCLVTELKDNSILLDKLRRILLQTEKYNSYRSNNTYICDNIEELEKEFLLEKEKLSSINYDYNKSKEKIDLETARLVKLMDNIVDKKNMSECGRAPSICGTRADISKYTLELKEKEKLSVDLSIDRTKKVQEQRTLLNQIHLKFSENCECCTFNVKKLKYNVPKNWDKSEKDYLQSKIDLETIDSKISDCVKSVTSLTNKINGINHYIYMDFKKNIDIMSNEIVNNKDIFKKNTISFQDKIRAIERNIKSCGMKCYTHYATLLNEASAQITSNDKQNITYNENLTNIKKYNIYLNLLEQYNSSKEHFQNVQKQIMQFEDNKLILENKLKTALSDLRIVELQTDILALSNEIIKLESALKQYETKEFARIKDFIDPVMVTSNLILSEYNMEIKFIHDVDCIDIQVETSDEKVGVEFLSGSESFILSLAIRKSILDNSNIPNPCTLFVDEGFGCLDDSNLDTFNIKIVPFLMKNFGNIFLITHNDKIKNSCTKRIAMK
uniref:Rad50/SbcC-type AAA domain-containing protein n=1 Tax=viral metagenome TaxID=1070528 RepID=A0A6C0JBI4_9ZZZZ